jgi:hypothetical protein
VEALRSIGVSRVIKRYGAIGLTWRKQIRVVCRESPWERVEAQWILGGAALKERARSLLRGSGRERSGSRQLRRHEFGAVAVVSQLKEEAWEDFRDRYGDWGRDLALWLSRMHCGLRLRELGELAGGLDYTTVSAATTRCSPVSFLAVFLLVRGVV